MERERMIVLTPPHRLGELRGRPVTPCHLAYRIGEGPHLMGSGLPASLRGGLMAVAGGPLSVGRPQNFCREILRECERRGFQGVLCDWEEPPTAFLRELLGELERQLADRGLQLYVPEEYAFCTKKAGLLVSSALCGGSLELRLKEGLERFGPDRLVLALQRSAEDFQLPAPEGRGRILKEEELKQMLRERQPGVFFSRELCARYFTYVDRRGQPHFVLFDDGDTMARKLEVGRGVGVRCFAAVWPEICDAADRMGLQTVRTGPGRR